ncbi:plasmid IncI1-type surface exclusion protein ExcA [Serratia symbiotica]|uniref:Plasmid IncI1-type surface exclusion protein ExcA n=1 Tax=Serratia symbiotica TaxID=138074 RepID=A0A068Z803_9GAMM|nr:plasmid IncI1-type surface exclusion protein ExcA [Serratia symbiotica]QLH64505.1 plasmid IncI1-type surface exclusion protein ExcA [Serratia symbiotica]CDS57060.1 Surface exclusion protein [Serratia symbiotica]
MQTVQRHDNWLDFIWALVRMLYYFVLLPCALLFSVITLPIVISSSFKLFTTDYFLLTMLWLTILIPLAIRRCSFRNQRRKLEKMVALLSRPDRFSPQKQHQVMDVGDGKYFGIDTRHGTLLYIHRVKKDVIDVIGLSMKDWTRRQLEGSALRLYTRMPDMPVLSIHAHPSVARVLFDTLDAMSHNHYDDPFPDAWPEYVKQQSRFIEFEHDVVVPQVA